MARVILFKAKRIDNGEWVMGGSIIQFLDDGVRSFYMPQFNEKCICKHDEVTDDILEFQNTRFYKVDGATICQYTGLTDKNGNKIWENDVVYARCNGLSGKGVIQYEKGCFVLKDSKRNRTYSLFGEWRFRVDGNIFDNPELLGGADNG